VDRTEDNSGFQDAVQKEKLALLGVDQRSAGFRCASGQGVPRQSIGLEVRGEQISR
jgi:hypothetical protein